MGSWRHPWIAFLYLLAALGGCAETNLAVHAVKQVGAPDAAPPRGGRPVKIGNPYQVAGIWYHPKDDPDYDETGLASWYGDPFHGRQTASGEVYDMNALTAAHKTLPLPSTVRVTNLENGRTLLLTVNDRGPFVNGRIIDISRRGSQLLGFHASGIAKVRVQVVPDGRPRPADTQVAMVAPRPQTSEEERRAVVAAPRGQVETRALAPPPGVSEAPAPPRLAPMAPAAPPSQPVPPTLAPGVVAVVPVKPTSVFVQAGAFSVKENADRLRGRLTKFGHAHVVHVLVEGRPFYRVRVGPLNTVDLADRTLERVIAEGNQDARIVVD